MDNDALFPRHPIVLVDDELSWLNSLTMTLEYEAGITHFLRFTDGREVLPALEKQAASLVLLDLNMPQTRGEDLLQQIIAKHPEIPIIVISGLNQIAKAVECMKLGAFDYFVKTDEKERILAGIRRALKVEELRQENLQLKSRLLNDSLNMPEAFASLVGADPRMIAVFRYLEAVAESAEPLLITGESGTGKELVARAFHQICRPNAPLVTVNVAGLDDHVFSDTLFGHTRGAFTGADRARAGMIERAEGGVLFLDEIGDLSLTSQVKLLRLLQEGEYLPLGMDHPKRGNARIVLATNQDLAARQQDGTFRRDLYFRLCVHQVHLPPLRERREDIPLLLEHFLKEAAAQLGKRAPAIPGEVLDMLHGYSFPGNIRELRGMVFNAMSLYEGGKLSLEPFRAVMAANLSAGDIPFTATNGKRSYAKMLAQVENLPTLRQSGECLVREALDRSRGNQTVAARLLGISQPALHKRLKKSHS